jgi:hypothetical protein
MSKPSVGRIVHYVSHGSLVRADGTLAFASECRAAIVTEVGETSGDEMTTVGLMAANPTGLFFHPLAGGGVRQAETRPVGGTWHWPERVD